LPAPEFRTLLASYGGSAFQRSSLRPAALAKVRRPLSPSVPLNSAYLRYFQSEPNRTPRGRKLRQRGGTANVLSSYSARRKDASFPWSRHSSAPARMPRSTTPPSAVVTKLRFLGAIVPMLVDADELVIWNRQFDGYIPPNPTKPRSPSAFMNSATMKLTLWRAGSKSCSTPNVTFRSPAGRTEMVIWVSENLQSGPTPVATRIRPGNEWPA